jgi:hypothetical protein
VHSRPGLCALTGGLDLPWPALPRIRRIPAHYLRHGLHHCPRELAALLLAARRVGGRWPLVQHFWDCFLVGFPGGGDTTVGRLRRRRGAPAFIMPKARRNLAGAMEAEKSRSTTGGVGRRRTGGVPNLAAARKECDLLAMELRGARTQCFLVCRLDAHRPRWHAVL